ncbi:MAG: hypothetical protein KF833_20925 [Verrucomicrobiae bacterium]|nr:hypothetical protein [Verrucomicrobiae bacterium]
MPTHDATPSPLVRRHLRYGWTGLLTFLTLGIALEVLHGFKVSWYLSPDGTQRRLLLTLAHAHGTLFSLVQIALAFTLRAAPVPSGRLAGCMSWSMTSGQILLPLGFLLGALWLIGGEPGPGIFLVPAGAAALLLGVGIVTLHLFRPHSPMIPAEEHPSPHPPRPTDSSSPSDRTASTPAASASPRSPGSGRRTRT